MGLSKRKDRVLLGFKLLKSYLWNYEEKSILFYEQNTRNVYHSDRNFKLNVFKGTVSILHAKMAMPDSQRYQYNLYLINNAKDIDIVLGLKVFNSDISYMFSCNKNAQVMFVQKPQLKINSFQDYEP